MAPTPSIATVIAVVFLVVASVRSSDAQGVGPDEKREILELLKKRDTSASREKLILRGPRVLPVLLEVVRAKETSESVRSLIFSTVREMTVPDKGEFVQEAATSLKRVFSTQALAPLALIRQSKDSANAPAVCEFFLRIVVSDDAVERIALSDIVETLLVVGTANEVKHLEKWLKDNPPEKFPAGKFRDARKVVEQAEKQLRAKLMK